MLDPQLANLTQSERQFKAPRSMRDVEPNVTILPRRFESPTGWIKAKNDSGKPEITQSTLRQSQLVHELRPGRDDRLAMVCGGREAASISGPRA